MRRLRSEHGFALPFALAVLIVSSIMLVSIVEYSSSNSRSAARGKGTQNAFTLSEAGLNNALAVLFNGGNVLTQGLMPACTLPEANWNLSTYDGGTVRWCGTLDLSQNLWNLKAIGIVDNPTGSTAPDVRRTLTATVPITPQATTDNSAQAWNYMFATRTGTASGCDLRYSNNVVVGSNVYLAGNLCLDNNVVLTSPKVIVGGKIDIATNGRIGASGTNNWSTRVEVQIAGSGGQYCRYSGGAWSGQTCGDAHHVYSKNAAATAMTVSYAPESITPPVPQWDNWYTNSAPGPRIACTTSSGTPPTWDNNSTRDGNNGSVGTVFDLAPASSSYSCVAGAASDPIGKLAWNHTTKVLTLTGTMFIDGSAKVTSSAVNRYAGYATLYLSGTFLMDNGAKLCAQINAGGTDCDYVGWNPNTNLLAVIANGDGSISGAGSQTGSTSEGGGNGVKLVNNVRFQGAFQSTKAIQLSNNAKVDGPMIASTIVVDNNVTPDAFPTITIAPSGLPGNPAVYAQPNEPQKFSG